MTEGGRCRWDLVCEIDDLTKTVFSGLLLPLVIDEVTDQGG
ncbi:hypothetical protein ACVMYR_31575 [Micromonospora sp. PTRAS2]